MSYITLLIFMPLFFLLNSSICLLWLSLYLRNRSIKNIYSNSVANYALLLLALTSALLLNSPMTANSAIETLSQTGSGASVLYQLITLGGALVYLLSVRSSEQYEKLRTSIIELHFIRLIILSSLLFIISSQDLLTIFLFLEVYSLSAYVLVAYRGKTSIFSSEAGVKYFILGTLFSLIMLYGISLLYSELGTINLNTVNVLFDPSNTVQFTALVFIVAGILFKLAAFPFHFWSPDVYEGSPTSIMYFLSVVPKAAILFVLIKLYPLILFSFGGELIAIAAAGSIIYGSVAGVYQKRIKRLLAYSAINNTGFILLAMISINQSSEEIVTLFLITYLITSSAIFIILLSNRNVSTAVSIKNISQLSNMIYTHKARALALAIMLFSSAGLPPLFGFFAKFLVLITSAWAATKFILIYALALSSLSVFYYIRIVKSMAFAKKRNFLFLKSMSATNALTLSAIITLLLSFLFLSGPFVSLAF